MAAPGGTSRNRDFSANVTELHGLIRILEPRSNSLMLSADENDKKRTGKSGARKSKAEPRKKKNAPQQESKPGQPQATAARIVEQSSKPTEKQIDAPVALADSAEVRSSLETTQTAPVEP